MKIRVSFKTPDAVEYAINGALVHAITDENESDADAVAEARDSLRDELQAVAGKYVSYGEYITVEFDTETGTATVIEKKRM